MHSEKYKYCNHHHEPTEDQAIVNIGGEQFVADKEMISLLTAMNDLGIKTMSHCCGHETKKPFIRISTRNIEFVDIRQYEGSIVICWKRS
jgi:pyruvate-formate lyase-activating enzyme